MDITISVSEEGLARIQQLLDVQNKTRASAGDEPFDLAAFVQSELEDHFQIHPDQIKARQRQEMMEQLTQLDDDAFTEVAQLVAAKASAVAAAPADKTP